MQAKIYTHLWYATDADRAASFYASIFPDSRVERVWTLPTEFNDAMSLVVECADQAELDRYWDALLEGGGQPQACGWLIDRYGVRWQIVPAGWETLMMDTDQAKAKRVADAMLKMVKLDIAALEQAHQG
jgi:predicted 3-demethylubiquinone-9 3-methyltransferase (glyoxalase superfamily)